MVVSKLREFFPGQPTRKDLTEQSAKVRAEIEKLTREISADAIRRARESTARLDDTPTHITSS